MISSPNAVLLNVLLINNPEKTQLFVALMIISFLSSIRMISEGSCDTGDWKFSFASQE